MSRYFEQMQLPRLRAEYPMGGAFLDGVARQSRDETRALQNHRFLKLMQRAWQVPFYRRRWADAGIEPGDIRGLDDLEKLPAFSKADLMASVEANPPFGDYHGVDLSGGWRPDIVFQTTSGTTGAPQPLFFGAHDRELQNLLLARAYRFQGLGRRDVVHSVYGHGMVNGGHYVREAILHFTDALLLSAGTGLETRSRQQVDIMHRFGATAIVGFVNYIKYLAEVAREAGLEPGRDIPVRLISGHLGQEDRAALSAAWGGAEVFDWYGVGDTGIIAAEGPDRDGLYVWDDAHVVEILDPDTGAVLPPGESGNICVTVLFKADLYPVIRFDTKDVSSFLTAPAATGLTLNRLAGFQGRSDNMVKLRGVNVYPTAIGAYLEPHPATTGEYVCRVGRDGDRDQMTVVVELRGDADRGLALQDEIAALLRQKLGVEVAVDLVGPGETAPLTQIEARQKPIRLIDERFT